MNSLLKLVTLPTYTATLPSTGQVIHFRPFVVKEEKIMLIALESKDPAQIINSIRNVLQSCIIEKIDVDSIPYFDMEYLFIQLRMRSMGEIVEMIVKDPGTSEKFETEMRLENIIVKNLSKDLEKFNIKFDENLGIGMKYPSLSKMYEIRQSVGKTMIETTIDLIISCIDKIYTKTEVINIKDKTPEEIKEFVENLPKKQFKMISKFFNELPEVVYEDVYVSPTTGNNIPIIVRDFTNFFD